MPTRCATTDIDDILADLNDFLERLHARAGADHKGSDSSRAGGWTAPVDEALAFFGFDPGTRPAFAEVNRAYLKFINEHHPDKVRPEEREGKNETMKVANGYRDYLRKELKP